MDKQLTCQDIVDMAKRISEEMEKEQNPLDRFILSGDENVTLDYYKRLRTLSNAIWETAIILGIRPAFLATQVRSDIRRRELEDAIKQICPNCFKDSPPCFYEHSGKCGMRKRKKLAKIFFKKFCKIEGL